MFVDTVKLTLIAGKGGNGVVAWRREKYIPKGGPTGGNGGRGGSILVKADKEVLSLQEYRHSRKIQAENGAPGGANLRQGKSGVDLILKVPPGTLIKDLDSSQVLFDLTEHGQEVVLCQGGKGGRGNASFKSPTHQAPNVFTEGTSGEIKKIEFELKLIAEVGLVGMPNAGKSTLMKKLTHVPVKIGAYPFTTLFPNLGYIRYEDYSHTLLADIPGIIENAHQDKGLGFAFLKHIERSKALVFVLDASGMEGRDPFDDFIVLQNELRAYDPQLLEKPFLVALNKCDLEEADHPIQEFIKKYPYPKDTLFIVSAAQDLGLQELIKGIRSLAYSYV